MTNHKKNIVLFLLLLLSSSAFAAVTINKLTGISNNNLVYSGLLPLSDTSSDRLFFTYYSAINAKQQSDLPTYPLLIAVGSPGSSAQYLNLAGIGPVTLKPDMTTVPNPNSVTQYANIMFLDLLGNGYSFVANTSSLPTKSQQYGNHIAYAIKALAKQSPLGQSKTIVIIGESTFLRSIPGLGDMQGLSGILHVSAWPQLYAVSRLYGVAGVEMKIFGNSQRISIESTLITCYNNVVNKKYVEAHNCYDAVLNFVESRTKNINVFNTRLGSNLTEHLAMIQYYFSLPNVVSQFKAPTDHLFETQSNWAWSKTFVDFAVNKTATLSQYMKDELSVKHWYISGDHDFISYKQSIKLWLQTQLNFIESTAFRNAKLQEVVIDGNIVGYSKEVKQLKYTELISSGHYVPVDQPAVFVSMLKNWLVGLGQEKQEHITKETYEIVEQ